jgi:hypothetical protein
MVVYGFKTDPVGGEALNEPVGLSVIDLPSTVSLADRLLDIRLRQMSFVKPKQGVIGPDKTLDGHRRESTCRAEPSRASEQTAALPKSPRIALNRPLFDRVAQASQRGGKPSVHA